MQTTRTPSRLEEEPIEHAGWFPAARRRRALLGASLVLLGFVALAWERQQQAAALGVGDSGDYLVVRRPLSPGERLTDADLRVTALPLAYAHAKAVPADALALVIDRNLRDGLAEGEVLLWSALAPEASVDARLSAMVRKGERAVAIGVDAIAAVGYFVAPGDRVDLFLSTRQLGSQVVAPILQNVSVLAVGNALAGQSAPESYGRIVVSVTPQEAELLLLAQQVGKLSLLLRQADDVEAEADFPILREEELLGSDLRKNMQERRNQRVVRVIRGAG